MSAPTSPSPEPTLSRLVQHFVAAKRSLSSTSSVYRANEIVEDARGFVEESAILGAKNTYIRHGVTEHVQVLHSVQQGLDSLGADAQLEFQAVIRSLDLANDRLQSTLSSLRKTLVNPSLNSSISIASVSDHAAAPQQEETILDKSQKTLHDFIDEDTHLSLLDALRSTIDSYNDAQATLQTTRTSFDESLKAVDLATQVVDELQSKSPKPSAEDEGPDRDSIPELFHSLTTHATETASLLQSLISHYDLCITALKHTEGGGEAARAATNSEADTTIKTDNSPIEESLYRNKIREPISEEERLEMLAVLENDAQEVDDVLLEIRERLSEMEMHGTQLSSWASRARKAHVGLQCVLQLLREIGEELPTHINAAKTFRSSWAELQEDIISKTEELNSLAVFYDNFIASYASLLREVERRQMVDKKMNKIAERARKDIEALYREDADMRGQFFKDVGEYLPKDIWPGLMDEPKRWEIRQMMGHDVMSDEQQNDNEVEIVQ